MTHVNKYRAGEQLTAYLALLFSSEVRDTPDTPWTRCQRYLDDLARVLH